MPRELKKRGRRGEEKKRKLEEEEETHQEFAQPKRQRTEDGVDAAAEQQDFVGLGQDGAYTNGDYQDGEGHGPPVEQVFFGMLDEEEQEYFKRADEMLEMNNFADAEERSLFLANVYREANGKELKIANSQSCSRLMERLIQLSTPAQLKTLFQKFSGNFMHLFQHRFASHCCEKLFIQAAPVVTEELLHPPKPEDQTTADDEVYVSMENLFLFTLGEMEGNVGFLMTDRFASHTLRVLLLVLAGEPLSDSTNKSLMQSKRKEHVTVNGSSADKEDATIKDKEDRRPVPKSFTEALEKLMTASVSGLDTTSLRALATHQLGNPALQLLIRLELTHFGKSKAKDENSIFRTLLPDDPITPECDSASFINGLLFDPIGSHLIECIIEHAPGKMFKSLYRGLLKDRMASLARNEIACYVVCKVLERLSKDDLLEAHEQICPQIPSLLERNRFAVIKTLIARCAVREIDSQAIAVQLSEAYSGPEGFDIVKLLRPDTDEPAANGNAVPEGMPAHIAEERANPHTIKLQGSLLAQCMILVPGALSALVLESLAALPPTTLQKMASDTIICRTLQAAMTSHNASIISRRKLIQQFFGHIGEMALDSKASRVVDAIWEGTHGLAFIRERIAEELNENEAALRDNPCGRAVWKNWKMDLYKRRRGEWVKQSKIKASNDGFQSFSEVDTNLKAANANANGQSVQHANRKTRHGQHQAANAQAQAGGEKKSAIQLARERHAANKARSQQAREKHVAGGSRPSASSNSSKHASGANAISSTKA
ncbi:PLP-dependent transferase, partial [Aureobasidium melanogenum]